MIPDRKRILSSRHAEVSYRDGAFYLTDTSSNGIQLKDSGASLAKGSPQRIEHGSVYCLGDFEIRARLVRDPAMFEGDIGLPQAAGSIIPDDAFLDLDPITALEQQERVYAEVDDLTAVLRPSMAQAQQRDYAQIDEENLLVPELVMLTPAPQPKVAPEPERLPPTFWEDSPMPSACASTTSTTMPARRWRSTPPSCSGRVLAACSRPCVPAAS